MMLTGQGIDDDSVDDVERRLPETLKDILNKTAAEITNVLAPFAKSIEEDRPPAKIYHYTDDNGLRGILENGNLWLTDIFGLNDPSELRHGIRMACDTLRELGHGDDVAEPFADVFTQVVNEGIEKIANFFVCSFSTDRDDLGQWRAYADDGRGFAVGFDAHALEQAFAKTSMATRWSCSTFPITYEDGKLIDFQKQMMQVVLPHVRNAKKMHLGPEISWTFVKGLSLRLALGCVNASIYFKHPAYANEREYRFLQLHRADDLLEGIRFRSRPYRLVRYMEFQWRELALDTLSEIVCGPAANVTLAKQFAVDCLKAFVPSRIGIQIDQSKIPYRGR